jgi:hypothetical protein
VTALREGQIWATAAGMPRDQATIRYIIADNGAVIYYRDVTHDGFSGNCGGDTEAEFRAKYPVLLREADR